MRLRIAVLCLFSLGLALSGSAAFAQVPFVAQPLVPAAVAPGGAAFTLTVNGSGFVSTSVVLWNGSPRPTTFVSLTQLTAAIGASDIALPSTAVVTVSNPGLGGGTSNVAFFQVTNKTSAVDYTSTSVSAGPANPVFEAVGDFNGDGKQDFAILKDDSSVTILLGNGDGTFRPPVSYPSTGTNDNLFASAIVVGDFNGDGKPDIAALHQYSFGFGANALRVVIFLGNGDGTFQPAKIGFDDTTEATSSHTLLAADFNRDGKLDLMVDCEGASMSGLCVLLGNGDGTFIKGATMPLNLTPDGSITQLADLNRDGKIDVALTYNDQSGNAIFAVALGNGDGTFVPPTTVDTIAPPTGGSVFPGLAVADFDGNGIPDLAADVTTCDSLNVCSANVRVYSGKGDGTFQPPVTSAVPSFSGCCILGDFNGDGILDLAGGSQISLGHGNGTFTANPATFPNGLVAKADFDGDGTLDFVSFTFSPLGGSSASVLLQKTNPDFGVSAPSPNRQAVAPGASASFTVPVTALFGWTSDVTLSVSGLPSGAAASFQPATITGGNGSGVLSISTTGATPVGFYPLTITGTSGSTTHSAQVVLLVATFAVSSAPISQSVTAGASTNFTVQVNPASGWTTNVALGVTGLPAGATASFQPATITGGNGSSALTISTTTATPAGTYTLAITGTAGSISRSTNVTLTVVAGDFSLVASPASQTVVIGGNTSYIVQGIVSGGWNTDVTLSVSGVPSGATAAFLPGFLPFGGSGGSQLSISTTTATPPGTYTLTIAGTGLGVTHSTTVTLIVTAADFTLSATPTSQTVVPGQNTSFKVQVSPLQGWTSDVALSVSGLPSGATAAFQPATITGGNGNAELQITTTRGVTSFGSYGLTVSGTGGGIAHSATVTLIVAKND